MLAELLDLFRADPRGSVVETAGFGAIVVGLIFLALVWGA